jgi:hypothetical protein
LVQCAFTWLHSHSTCPICRKELSAIMPAATTEEISAATRIQNTIRTRLARRRVAATRKASPWGATTTLDIKE